MIDRKELLLFLTHMRIPFQLTLAPFFLLGVWLAPAQNLAVFFWSFFWVHFGLYGGATVYNSHFDQDEGPIGMLKSSAKTSPWMHPASLLLQGCTVLALMLTSVSAGLVTLVLMLLGIAYSHPAIRLKSRTIVGLMTVALGQGALSVFLGYTSNGGYPINGSVLKFGLATSLIILAIYPLTQIYQIDEDARRGDRTLPVVKGWRFSMFFSGVIGLPAIYWIVTIFLQTFSSTDEETSIFSILACSLYLIYLGIWAGRFVAQTDRANHDWAMFLSAAIALPIGLLIFVDILRKAL